MNPLFNELPGQSCHTVSLDLMHCKYLGHDMYFFGSVLTLLCQYLLPGSEEQNLKRCWDFLKRFYKEHSIPSPYRYLTKISMFIRKKKFPKLRGKASEVRHLAKPLSALWAHFMNKNVETHRQIDLYLRLNIQFENILDDHKDDYALPLAAYTAFMNVAFSVLITGRPFYSRGYTHVRHDVEGACCPGDCNSQSSHKPENYLVLPRRRHDAEKSSFATKLRSRQQRSPLLQEDACPL